MAKSTARETRRLGKQPLVCSPKSRLDLDPNDWGDAVRQALELNPTNGTNLRAMAAQGATMTPQFIAIAVGNYWGSKGVDLPVFFMDQTTAGFRNKFLAFANLWGNEKGGNIKFRWTQNQSEKGVRLSRGRTGLWSYLGPDILNIPLNQPTMNLEGFVESTPDSEWHRACCHEVGHTLGCIHDQLRKAIQDLLDREKVIAEFMRTQGWSRQEVIAQILTPVEESELITLAPADELSIMTYQFSGRVTKNGQPILGGSRITDKDYELIRKAYPKQDAPPPPSGGKKKKFSFEYDPNTGAVSSVTVA